MDVSYNDDDDEDDEDQNEESIVEDVNDSFDNSNEDVAEEQDDMDSTDDLSGLLIPQVNPARIIRHVLRVVLDHPITHKFFLGQIDVTSKVRHKKRHHTVRQAFTAAISAFLNSQPLCNLAKDLRDDLQGYLLPFASRFVSDLKETLAALADEQITELPAELSKLHCSMFPLILDNDFHGISNAVFRLPAKLLTHTDNADLADLLEASLFKLADSTDMLIPDPDAFCAAALVISKSSMTCLINALVLLLQKRPLLVISFDRRFLHIDVRTTAGGLRVVKEMLRHSEMARLWFEREDAWQEHQLLLVYLQNAATVSASNLKCVLQSQLKSLQHSRSIDDHSVTLLSSACNHSNEKDVKKTMMSLVATVTDNSAQGSFSAVVALVAIYTEMVQRKMAVDGIQQEYVMALVSIVIRLLKKSKIAEHSEEEVVKNAIEALLQVDDLTTGEQLKDEELQSLYRLILKYRFDDPSSLRLLTHMFTALGGNAGEIYSMILGHSRFLPTMLNDKGSILKDSLVELLLTLVQKDASGCDGKHIAVLLSAYTATLSLTDQRVLRLLHCYEQQGCTFGNYKPYLWGSSSAASHSTVGQHQSSLDRQATIEKLLDYLDASLLWKSALKFPMRRSGDLIVQEVCELNGGSTELYDPCFVLPLLARMMGTECIVSCWRVVQHGCLAYALSALSSHDSHIRSLAYHVLAQFYLHAEATRFGAKDQILCLLDFVKNSIAKKNGKLAPIITIFLAKVSMVLMQPDDPLYSVLNAFLLIKPSIDVLNVPEFFKLFNSSAPEFKKERSWILQLLIEGLRETADFRIFEKRYTFKLLLSFYNSNVSDEHCQLKVLEVVNKACYIKTAATSLLKDHGLLQWLSAVISTCPENYMPRIINLLHTLWQTLLGDRDMDVSKPDCNECLPIQFSNQMLLVLLLINRKVTHFSTADAFQKLVYCWNSVVKHLEKTKEYHQKNGHNVTMLQSNTEDISTLLQHFLVLKKHISCSDAENVYKKFENDLLDVKNEFEYDVAVVDENCRENLIKNACEMIVELTAHCKVHAEINRSRFFCAIIGWCLTTINSGVSTKVCLKFIHWLLQCLDKCTFAVDLFIADNDCGRMLLSLLINVYFIHTKSANSQHVCMIMQHVNEVQENVNKVFMVLVDKSVQSKNIANFVTNVRSTVFQKTTKRIQKSQQNEKVKRLMLLFQEAVLGCKTNAAV